MIFRIKPGHYIPHVVDLLLAYGSFIYSESLRIQKYTQQYPQMFTRVLLQEIFQISYYILIW